MSPRCPTSFRIRLKTIACSAWYFRISSLFWLNSWVMATICVIKWAFSVFACSSFFLSAFYAICRRIFPGPQLSRALFAPRTMCSSQKYWVCRSCRPSWTRLKGFFRKLPSGKIRGPPNGLSAGFGFRMIMKGRWRMRIWSLDARRRASGWGGRREVLIEGWVAWCSHPGVPDF